MVTDLVGAAALTATAIPVAGLAIPTFGPLLAPVVAPAAIAARLLFEKDMFLMTNDPGSLQARGVVSHEYGHFVMCDVFSRVDSDALTSLYAGLLADGVKAERRTQDIPVMLESFADFIASQLTGGANYSQIHEARPSLSMRYCDGTLNPANPDESCFERNHRGVNDSVAATEFQDEVARRMTTYHDAFDARVNAWRDETSDVPTNADPWRFTQRDDDLDGIFEKQILSEAREPYINGGDDFVELPGAALRQWFTNAWSKSDDQQGLSITRFLAGLSQTMTEQHGVSWCDACDMFVKHDNTFDASAMGVTQQQIWAACNSGELREILGPPPDADLRLDKSRGISSGKNCAVCTGRDFSNADGLCETCPDGTIVVHNVCEPCPPGEIQVGNMCQTCGTHAIAVNNMCESCPAGRVRYPGTNVCASCAPDVIVNWTAFERPGCADKTFLDIGDPSASMWGTNDLCPEFFVVELKGLTSIASTTAAASRLRVRTEGYVPGSLTAAQCATHTEQYEGTNVLWSGLTEGASAPISVDVSGALCPSFNTCPHQCLFPATVVSDFASSTFDATADTLRVSVRTDTLSSPETKLVAWTEDKCSIIN